MLRERAARLPRGGHRGRRQGRPHPGGAALDRHERRDRRDSRAPRQVHQRGRSRGTLAPGLRHSIYFNKVKLLIKK